ncbi:hypothetical protein CAAN1_24S01112 [[Candida] anglica]|uniref:DUF300-domain-containing protein n=1 Tax=[Candida] anglica TaxID=148631 RepID=A0ABP0EG36_9ASCO
MPLPDWIITLSGWSSLIASLIIFSSIFLHLLNYRKPFDQRLMIRIQLIVPLFAASCFAMLVDPGSVFNRFVLEPTREIYEAFVIYTFFSLLTQMLGGERNIIIRTSGREPVPHPGLVGYIFPDLDISDPHTFMNVKRGILQYVWLKPIICFSILFTEVAGVYNVNDTSITSVYLWLTIIYNASVSLSLYCLAIFWKILWTDLKPFEPVGKFLCVKLIIFASYWQGILLAIFNMCGWLPQGNEDGSNTNIGTSIQNALLCVELIFFAIGHWYSFSYVPFTISHIPNGRLQFWYALKDVLGVKDLVHDFQLTFYGDYYKDYKQFDSVEALIAHPDSRGRMSRINQGLRYHSDGTQKHWLGGSTLDRNVKVLSSENLSTSESQAFQFGEDTSSNMPPNDVRVAAATAAAASGGHTSGDSTSHRSIQSTLGLDSFAKEQLDEDEQYYVAATSVINNYNLDQREVKRLLNYPIVDEVVDGHLFGHKVKKLRAERLRQQQTSGTGDYGSMA